MLWLLWVRMVNQSPTHVTRLLTHHDESLPTTSHCTEQHHLAKSFKSSLFFISLTGSYWVQKKSTEIKPFILVGVLAQERLIGQFIVQVVIVFINNKSILEMSIQIVVTLEDVSVCRTVT